MNKSYAELFVKSGGNVQPGQPVVISSDIRDAIFARMVQDACYDAGASDVHIQWTDDVSLKTWYNRAADKNFDDYPQWQVDRLKYFDERGAVYFRILSSDPDLLKGVDPDKILRYTKVSRTATKAHSALTMSSKLRWSLIAVPSIEWAAKVFPDMSEKEAFVKLEEAIAKGARADGADPIADWQAHHETFVKRLDFLNDAHFDAIRFTNSLGTDITVGLAQQHLWSGGGDTDHSGIPFFPNLPTEEVFTVPDRNNVNGVVVASMPLSYQGNLIEGFSLTFENGRVVDYSAETGYDTLKNLIEIDEGARYLGELALVSNKSPISEMGILFYNTLFDENASSHLALGKAYPKNIIDGIKKSEEELKSLGINDSIIHVDFMFGTDDMKAVGIKDGGSGLIETVVMENGDFV